MGNKTSTQAGVFKEKSKKQKKTLKNDQIQRRKQKQQKKLKILRGGNNASNGGKTKRGVGGVVDAVSGDGMKKGRKHKSKNVEKKTNDKHKEVNTGRPQNERIDQIVQQNQNNVRPNTPLLEPKIEENVSDIEEAETTEQGNESTDALSNKSEEKQKLVKEQEETPSLTQYLARGEVATSPTATDSSYDRSFGMDSFDSSSSPQKHFVFDTSALHCNQSTSNTNNNHMERQRNESDDVQESAQKLPSSPLFSIQESAADNSGGETSNPTPPTENNKDSVQRTLFDDDDNDQFSDASSQSDDEKIFHGADSHSLDGSESLLSQGSCTEFDNMSKGVVSISEKSLSSIPSIIMKNKQHQRSKLKNNQDHDEIAPLETSHSFNSSTSSLSPTTNHSQIFSSSRSVISCTDLSIHSRRTKVKRSRRDASTKRSARPNATNAFETLPRHLIKTGLLRQTAATLRDERFLRRRIEKLGPEFASKVHVLDFDLLQKKDEKNAERREKERDAEGGGLEAELPSAQTFPDGDDFFSVMMDSFDLFLKCILEMCAITTQENIFEVEEGCEIPLIEGDEEDCDEEEIEKNLENQGNVIVMPQRVEPKVAPEVGGKAIFILGKFVQNKGWIHDAMFFFRHALYLSLLECDVDEPRLMDEAEDCEGLFYDDIAVRGTTNPCKTHEILGTILIKMGDVHGKNLEINDALRAYRASQIFWSTYLTNHKVSNEENGDKDDDPDELTDFTASVEGLALTHTRIGGVYTSKGDLGSALESFHEALELQIDALGDDHLEVAKTLHNVGVCHRHNDEWDEALDYYIRAHVIFKKVLGKNHLDTARTLHNIGGVYRRKRMYPEALECFKQVLFTRRKLLGDDHPSVSIALVSIAASLRRSGRTEEANKFYAAAVR